MGKRQVQKQGTRSPLVFAHFHRSQTKQISNKGNTINFHNTWRRKLYFFPLTGNASLTSSPSWIQSSMGPASWKGGRVGSTTLPLPRRRISASALSSASAWDRKMGRSTKSQRLTSSSRRTGRTFLLTSMSNSYATACPTSASRTSNPDTLSPSAWNPSPFTIASLRSCGRRRNRSVPSQIR
jgi:hypothetical protein